MRCQPLRRALCLSEKFMVNWPCILKLDGDDELVYLSSEADLNCECVLVRATESLILKVLSIR